MKEDNQDSQVEEAFSVNEEDTRTAKELEKKKGLDRVMLMPGQRSTKVLISLILGTLILVCFIWIGSGLKEKRQEEVAEQDYTSNFKPANFSVYVPPKAPETTQETPKIDAKAEALKEARRKSAILIYENYDTQETRGNYSSSQSISSDPNRRFQQEMANTSVPVSQIRSLGSLEHKILQGKVLSATLETAVNSDLPGMVRAILSENVYGEMGRQVLLPRGSRLIGEYNSAIRKGQARVFLVWSRAILPNGTEILLQSAGTDPLGRAGIRGKVNHHFWQIFGTSALLSVLSATTANVGVDATTEYNSMSAYREELATSFQDSSAQVLDRYIDIPPTIQVRAGTPIKILVARDLDFSTRASVYSSSNAWVIRP